MPESDPHFQQRRRMVQDQIRARGIHDERVLQAMEQVPRELFMPSSEQVHAFEDRALPIDAGQTISQPYMVAAMTTLLRVHPDHRVLEIGTGSGYQTAVLARLAARVYTIERIPELQAAAHILLEDMGVWNVSYRVGDGTVGWPEQAPFDRIMVTAGAPEIPQPLLDQLRDGGRMVIPVGTEEEQTLTVVDRSGDRIEEMPRFPCRFVKLIGAQGWQEK